MVQKDNRNTLKVLICILVSVIVLMLVVFGILIVTKKDSKVIDGGGNEPSGNVKLQDDFYEAANY